MRPIAALLLFLVTLVGACAAPPAPTSVPAAPQTPAVPPAVVDDLGRLVALSAAPRRIVSIAPSNTEILFALGLGARVVAVDQYSNYPPEARQKEQVGSYVKPDLERIVAASPDLVLATAVHARTVVPELEARRIAVFVVDPRNIDDVFDRISRVGRIAGVDAHAAAVVASLRERADAVAARVAGAPRPRVFFELSPQLHTAGPGSFVDDLIRRAGGENVAGDAGAQWPQLGQEIVVQRDPEVVLMAHGDLPDPLAALRARPGWSQISAVRNGRVQAVDPDVVTRAGPRVVDGLELFARSLHPERFG